MKYLIGLSILTVSLVPGFGSTISGSFANPPTGTLGTTQTYTNFGGGGQTIIAAGFTDTGTAIDLYGKALGAGETGLGLVNDPSGEHEITTGSFIQLDVSSISSFSPLTIFMGSTTNGEKFQITESNTNGSLGTCGSFCIKGTSNGAVTLTGEGSTFKYLDVTSLNGNVLLGSLSYNNGTSQPTPEPVSFALAGTGLIGIYFLGRRKKRSNKTEPQV